MSAARAPSRSRNLYCTSCLKTQRFIDLVNRYVCERCSHYVWKRYTMKEARDGWGGWSDEVGGPDGLFALVVPGLGLSTTVALSIRGSLWAAMTRMKADPRWAAIKSPEDAAQLVREYL